jgi:hypothetical protein
MYKLKLFPILWMGGKNAKNYCSTLFAFDVANQLITFPFTWMISSSTSWTRANNIKSQEL